MIELGIEIACTIVGLVGVTAMAMGIGFAFGYAYGRHVNRSEGEGSISDIG